MRSCGTLLVLLIFNVGCKNNPVDESSGINPEITIFSNTVIFWYSDSLLEDFIFPSQSYSQCDTSLGIPCGVVSMTLDYRCTVLPDTLYGIVKNSLFIPETLHCIKDSCRVLNSATLYSIKKYRDSLVSSPCLEWWPSPFFKVTCLISSDDKY